MRMTSFPLSAVLLTLGLAILGCTSPSGSIEVAKDAAAGGSPAKGGAGGNGGTSATGGASASGGKSGAGGAPSSGGTSASGGVAASGGNTSTGGATGGATIGVIGGAASTGGALSTGGAKASGGAGGSMTMVPDGSVGPDSPMDTGGARPTGGAASAGGKVGSGGAGGALSTGGGMGMGGSTTDGGAPTTTATIPGKGCTPPAAYNNLFVSVSGHTQAKSDAKVAAAWSKLFNPKGPGNIYFDGPGTDESYVKDIYNGDVRTEGMGYGMVIAAQLDHQTEFDRLWNWVKTHMARSPGNARPRARKCPAVERPTAKSTWRPPSSSPTIVGATRPGSSTMRPRPSGCST